MTQNRPLKHFSQLNRINLVVFIISFALMGGLALFTGLAATPKNIWVSATGNDSTCAVGNQSLPCLTIDKAYHLVPDGGIVYLSAGTYPYQRLTLDTTKTGAAGHVVIQPAPGVAQSAVHILTVDFGQDQLNIKSAQHVTLQDVTLDSTNASAETWNSSNDIELDNLVGHALQLLGGTKLRVYGGDWGKCTVTSDSTTNCTSRMIGSDVIIDGASIHDVVHNSSLDPQNLNHTEGIFVRGCSDCTVTHSKFWHNTTFDIFVQNCCSLPPNKNVHIYNSWLAATGSGSTGNSWGLNTAIEVTNSVPGFQLIHNSFAENAAPVWAFNTQGDSWAGTGALVADNLYMRGGGDCAAGMTYRGNIYIPFSQFTGQQICDPSEKKVTTFKYINYTQDSDFDYHLSPGSSAIGAASPLDSATAGTDIDGYAWPASAPDSGSDQYGKVGSAPLSGPSGPSSSGSGGSAPVSSAAGSSANSGTSSSASSGASKPEGTSSSSGTAGTAAGKTTGDTEGRSGMPLSSSDSASKKANKPTVVVLSVISAASAIAAAYFTWRRLNSSRS